MIDPSEIVQRIGRLERELERRRIEVPTYHAARVYHSANQSIANGSLATLSFNSESYDYGGMHDTVTNNSRITAQVAGVYQISGGIFWDGSIAGSLRILSILLNATSLIGDVYEDGGGAIGANGCLQFVTAQYYLNLGDFIQLQGLQSSGGALNSVTLGARAPWFAAVRVGP